MEKEYSQTEGTNAYRLSSFQNEKKKHWEDELIIASRELEFLNEKNEKRVAEFIISTNDNNN